MEVTKKLQVSLILVTRLKGVQTPSYSLYVVICEEKQVSAPNNFF
jgi:hypothetical protein